MSTENDLLILHDQEWMTLQEGRVNGSFEDVTTQFFNGTNDLKPRTEAEPLNFLPNTCQEGFGYANNIDDADSQRIDDSSTSSASYEIGNSRPSGLVHQSWDLTLALVRKRIQSLKRRVGIIKKNPTLPDSRYWRQICRRMRGKYNGITPYRLNSNCSLDTSYDGDGDDNGGEDDSDGGSDYENDDDEDEVDKISESDSLKNLEDFDWGSAQNGEKERRSPATVSCLDKNANASIKSSSIPEMIATNKFSTQKIDQLSFVRENHVDKINHKTNHRIRPKMRRRRARPTYVEFANNIVCNAQGYTLEAKQTKKNHIVSKIRRSTTSVDVALNTGDDVTSQQQAAGLPNVSSTPNDDISAKSCESNTRQNIAEKYAKITEMFTETVKEFIEFKSIIQAGPVEEIVRVSHSNHEANQSEMKLCARPNNRFQHTKKMSKNVGQSPVASIRNVRILRHLEDYTGATKEMAINVREITTKSTRVVCLEVNQKNECAGGQRGSVVEEGHHSREFMPSNDSCTWSVSLPVCDNYLHGDARVSLSSKSPPQMNETERCSKYFKEVRDILQDHLKITKSGHEEKNIVGEQHHEINNAIQKCSPNFDAPSNDFGREIRRFVHHSKRAQNEQHPLVNQVEQEKKCLQGGKSRYPPHLRSSVLQGTVQERGHKEEQLSKSAEKNGDALLDAEKWRLPSQIILSFLSFGLELERKKMSTIVEEESFRKNPKQALLDLMGCVDSCVNLCEKFCAEKKSYFERREGMSRLSHVDHKDIIVPTTAIASQTSKLVGKNRYSLKEKNNIALSIENLPNHDLKTSEPSFSPSDIFLKQVEEEAAEHPGATLQRVNMSFSCAQTCIDDPSDLCTSPVFDSQAIIYRNISSNRPASDENVGNAVSQSNSPIKKATFIKNINTEFHLVPPLRPEQQPHQHQSVFTLFEIPPKQQSPEPDEPSNSNVFSKPLKRVSTYRIRKQRVDSPCSPCGERIEIRTGPLLSKSPALSASKEGRGKKMTAASASDKDQWYEIKNYGMDRLKVPSVNVSSLLDNQSPSLPYAPCKCKNECRCGAAIIRRASEYLKTRVPLESKGPKSFWQRRDSSPSTAYRHQSSGYRRRQATKSASSQMLRDTQINATPSPENTEFYVRASLSSPTQRHSAIPSKPSLSKWSPTLENTSSISLSSHLSRDFTRSTPIATSGGLPFLDDNKGKPKPSALSGILRKPPIPSSSQKPPVFESKISSPMSRQLELQAYPMTSPPSPTQSRLQFRNSLFPEKQETREPLVSSSVRRLSFGSQRSTPYSPPDQSFYQSKQLPIQGTSLSQTKHPILSPSNSRKSFGTQQRLSSRISSPSMSSPILGHADPLRQSQRRLSSQTLTKTPPLSSIYMSSPSKQTSPTRSSIERQSLIDQSASMTHSKQTSPTRSSIERQSLINQSASMTHSKQTSPTRSSIEKQSFTNQLPSMTHSPWPERSSKTDARDDWNSFSFDESTKPVDHMFEKSPSVTSNQRMTRESYRTSKSPSVTFNQRMTRESYRTSKSPSVTSNQRMTRESYRTSKSPSVTFDQIMTRESYRTSKSPSVTSNQRMTRESYRTSKSPSVTSNQRMTRESYRTSKSPSVTSNQRMTRESFRTSKSPSATSNQRMTRESLRTSKSPSATSNQRMTRESLRTSKSPSVTSSQRMTRESYMTAKSASATSNQRMTRESLRTSKSPSATSSQRMTRESYRTSGNSYLQNPSYILRTGSAARKSTDEAMS